MPGSVFEYNISLSLWRNFSVEIRKIKESKTKTINKPSMSLPMLNLWLLGGGPLSILPPKPLSRQSGGSQLTSQWQ